ncbi:MAG: hypothetical protein ACREI3_02370, partial [Nitrospirales bacterium]
CRPWSCDGDGDWVVGFSLSLTLFPLPVGEGTGGKWGRLPDYRLRITHDAFVGFVWFVGLVSFVVFSKL